MKIYSDAYFLATGLIEEIVDHGIEVRNDEYVDDMDVSKNPDYDLKELIGYSFGLVGFDITSIQDMFTYMNQNIKNHKSEFDERIELYKSTLSLLLSDMFESPYRRDFQLLMGFKNLDIHHQFIIRDHRLITIVNMNQLHFFRDFPKEIYCGSNFHIYVSQELGIEYDTMIYHIGSLYGFRKDFQDKNIIY